MPTPTAVIFDLGGVLIDWNPRYLYRSLFDGDEEGMEWFLTNVTTPAWNEEQDRGRPWSEAIELLVQQHPDHERLIRAYHERWEEMLGGAHHETVDVLRRLRADPVRLFALTNWSAETFDMARHRFPFLAWFEGVVVSGHEKIAKPDLAIFRVLLERYRLEPRTTLFIDDNEANVRAAASLGLEALPFTDAASLTKDLEARGLLAGGSVDRWQHPG